jgi:CubicO group peptidase (beta-lactamase class C family)
MMAVQHGKVLALEVAGFADAATKTPMRTDAIFDIQSISKPFTVFATFLLIDEGKIALDDPLSKLLPEFADVKVKRQTQPTNVPITIRQMMMHSSGIAEDRPPELENITRTFDHTLAEDVALVAQQPWTLLNHWRCTTAPFLPIKQKQPVFQRCTTSKRASLQKM